MSVYDVFRDKEVLADGVLRNGKVLVYERVFKTGGYFIQMQVQTHIILMLQQAKWSERPATVSF